MTAEKDIHQILSAFIESNHSENNLEDYWIKNETALTTLKTMNAELYENLIEQFKVRRKEIQDGEKED
jgi:tryptophanyl-tRNA synthetase